MSTFEFEMTDDEDEPMLGNNVKTEISQAMESHAGASVSSSSSAEVEIFNEISRMFTSYKFEIGQEFAKNEFIGAEELEASYHSILRYQLQMFQEKFSSTYEENLFFKYRDRLIASMEEDFRKLHANHRLQLQNLEQQFTPLIQLELADFVGTLNSKINATPKHFQRIAKNAYNSTVENFFKKRKLQLGSSTEMYVQKRLKEALDSSMKQFFDMEEQRLLSKIEEYGGHSRATHTEIMKWFSQLFEVRLDSRLRTDHANGKNSIDDVYQTNDDLAEEVKLHFADFLQRYRRHFVIQGQTVEGLKLTLSKRLESIFKKKISQDIVCGSQENSGGMTSIPLAFAISGTRKAEEKPKNWVYFSIPCAGKSCTRDKVAWTCRLCLTVFEFGFNNLVYCECGQTPVSAMEYKCMDPNHGYEFLKYDPDALLKELSLIPPRRDINILILGETGVGKSTWINAFANFRHYSSLHEAEENELIKLIPTQFTVTKNGQRIVVKTGEDGNEVQGNGQSATQKAKIYVFEEGNTTVRLIDTPGVGDTRGYSHDYINFKNILDTLEGLGELHGICILLKPNNARVSVVFRFCVKELLTHLHRDASKNIMFGFTNSRGTYYEPGDTMDALMSILNENRDVEIPLNKDTIYCYDSEPYRFLAALKNDPPLMFPSEWHKDASQSWDVSVKQTKRMMDYICSLPPHPIRSTINLNHARSLVVKLTRPLAEISRNIQTNKTIIKEELDRIRRTEEDIDKLSQNLMMERTEIEVTAIPYPKTVCSNSKCVKVWKINDDVSTTEYVQICHDHCFLDGVRQDSIGDPGLMYCKAMSNNICIHNECGHTYKEHLHVYYDSKQVIKRVEDQSVKQALEKNLSAKELKKELIETKTKLIAEYEEELQFIREASVRFAYFLKTNAITPYNDAMEDYLDFLIHEERRKVSVGGNRGTLDLLVNTMDSYKQERDILEKAMKEGLEENSTSFSPRDMEILVNQLKLMKHHGESLQNALECVDKTTYVVQQQAVVVPQNRSKLSLSNLVGRGRRMLNRVFQAVTNPGWLPHWLSWK